MPAAPVGVLQAHFAYKLGVKSLFKYRGFRTPEHREFLRQILLDNRVYFARASELKDQDDLRPIVRIRPQPTEQLQREVLLEGAERFWARQSPPPSNADKERYRLRLRTHPIAEIERESAAFARRLFEERYPIFCLSTHCDSARMWQEYGDDFRGVCLEFSSVPMSPFGMAQRVDYEAERPPLLFPSGDDHHEDARRCLLVKTMPWAHESEFRLVGFPDVSLAEIGFLLNGQFGTFPPEVLTGVSIGRNMPEEAIRALLGIVAARPLPVQVWRRASTVVELPERLL